MGMKLFTHAVRLVLDNLRAALRISGVLYLIQILAVLGLSAMVDPRAPMEAWLPLLLGGIIAIVCAVWTAVAWHRFVLLGEINQGLLPAFDSRRMLAYFGYSLLLGLISIPIVLVVGLLVGLFAAVGGVILAMLSSFVAVFVVLIVGYRLALVLPASSIDRPLRLGEAWEATKGATGDIIGLALISAICAIVISLPALAFTGPLALLGIIWNVLTQWFVLLIGITILTTLFGHYIEGRPVSE